MEACPVYSCCCLKECMVYVHIQIPKVPCFVCLPNCYGIGGKCFKSRYPDKIGLKDNY